MPNSSDTNFYRSEVFWSEEDDGFIAVAPELLGCNAFGETRVQAMEELQGAIASWIEAATVSGKAIPTPITHKGYHDRSGKILVRMPRELHHSLVNEAEYQGISLNQYVCYLLTRECSTQVVNKNAMNASKVFHHSNSVGNSTHQVVVVYQGFPTVTKPKFQSISKIVSPSHLESKLNG